MNKKEKSSLNSNIHLNSWFIGFFDGEGYFNIMRKTVGKKTFKTFRIAITVSERDKNALDEIKKAYGGRLSFRKKLKAFPNGSPQWTWYLGKYNQIKELLPLFKNLKTKNKVERFNLFLKEFNQYKNYGK